MLGECLESVSHAIALRHEVHLRLTSIVPRCESLVNDFENGITVIHALNLQS
jgi:hypothetical protein